MATSSFYNSSGSTPTQATDIATSVDQAQDAAQEAEATLNEFKTLYMGIYSTAPVASQTGSLYYNDTTHLLYYWNGTNWTATNTSVADTDGLAEGSTNLYFSAERVDDQVNTLLTAGSNITLAYNDAAGTLTIASTASGGGSTITSTDDLTEGSSNLYFTNARVDARISTSDTDALAEGYSNLYFTDERVDDRVNNLLVAGSNITLTYNDAANTLTIASTASGSGGIALTDLSVTQNSASGTGLLAYNNTTGSFTYTPPDLSGYATTSSLSSYLTGITGESLSNLSDVSPATPTNGQVLTWDNSTSLWQPVTPSSTGGGGGIYVGVNSTGTGVTTSGTDGIAMGLQASAINTRSIAIGRTAYVSHDDSVVLGGGGTSSDTRQLTLGAVNNTQGFTSIRVGNTSYTPTVSMDLTTKSYVDTAVANAGGGGSSSNQSPNIVTGTYTTTSTSFVDAGEIVDTDDGFTGAFQCAVSAQIGTGSQASAWFGVLNFAYNKESPNVSNWNTLPWFGNGINLSTHNISAIRLQPRWDTSTNKIYLQVKNGSSTSTVYTWTATLI